MTLGHSGLMICFLVIFGVFNLLATSAVSGLTKGAIDRSLGIAFGLFRGALISSFIFFIIFTGFATFGGSKDHQSTEDMLPEIITSAKTYGFLTEGKDMIKEFIPDSFYKGIHEAYDQISSKSIDERFIENMMKRFTQNIDKDQLNEINQNAQNSSNDLSEQQIQHQKLEELLDAYKSQQSSGTETKSAISEEDISRLESMLKNLKAKNAAKKPSSVILTDE
jgi:uncharacterized membrane protein required for colicin V production